MDSSVTTGLNSSLNPLAPTRPYLLQQASESEFKKNEPKNGDARPIGAQRTRYAAVIDIGEGEGGSNSNESCEVEGDDDDGEDGDARMHAVPMCCWCIYSGTLRAQTGSWC